MLIIKWIDRKGMHFPVIILTDIHDWDGKEIFCKHAAVTKVRLKSSRRNRDVTFSQLHSCTVNVIMYSYT